jgi:hypothetical protein
LRLLDIDRTLLPGVQAVSDFAAMLIIGGTVTVLVGSARYFQGRTQSEAARFHPAGVASPRPPVSSLRSPHCC